MPSGLSCVWRMVTAGKASNDDSSVMVPLSDTTQAAFICSWT